MAAWSRRRGRAGLGDGTRLTATAVADIGAHEVTGISA